MSGRVHVPKSARGTAVALRMSAKPEGGDVRGGDHVGSASAC